MLLHTNVNILLSSALMTMDIDLDPYKSNEYFLFRRVAVALCVVNSLNMRETLQLYFVGMGDEAKAQNSNNHNEFT